MAKRPTRYAIIQHTGVLTGHAEFEQAVESRAVTTAADQDAVTNASGLLFDTYGEAEDFCEAANYPPGVEGLIPRAAGSFTTTATVLGCKIYLPVREVTVIG